MQISLPESITKNLENTKSLVDHTVNSINQNVQQAKTVVIEGTNQSVTSINKITENVKHNFTGTASNALDNVTEKGSQIFSSITNASNTLKNSLQTTIQKIDALNQTLSDGIQASINSSLNNWIDQHPQLVWCINHPLQCLFIFMVGIILFSGLLGALSKLTEKFWLFILTSLLKMLAKSWRFVSKFWQKENAPQKNETQKRITEILNRLEVIRKEQTLLSQELESLLKSCRHMIHLP